MDALKSFGKESFYAQWHSWILILVKVWFMEKISMISCLERIINANLAIQK